MAKKNEPMFPRFKPNTWQEALVNLLDELTRLAKLAADQLEAEQQKKRRE